MVWYAARVRIADLLFFFSSGTFGVIFGLIAVFVNDGDAVRTAGFFQGYNSTTWVVISLQVSNNNAA